MPMDVCVTDSGSQTERCVASGAWLSAWCAIIIVLQQAACLMDGWW